METVKPLQIVITPVRNEAWVLRAFLETTALWADYIIVADQMSTDGSREIYWEFKAAEHHCQLIVIDNTNSNFNEAERQAMLVKQAREIEGGRDTLLWGLDADELLPANWQETDDGRHILNSIPGDVFWFKCAQLSPDKTHYGDSPYFPWLFHDDGKEPHKNYVRNMHSSRIPYPIEEKQMYYVKDFRVLHCGLLDPNRIAAKGRFYQFVDWTLNHRSPATLAETYSGHRKENQNTDFPLELETFSTAYPFDMWRLIDMNSTHIWFDDYVFERLCKYPMPKLRRLDIWDDEFLAYYQITDPRTFVDKCVHRYFHQYNHRRRKSLALRAINKMLKIIYLA